MSTIWLCLSSNSRPRFMDDIIRSLAVPEGERIRFRYDVRWINVEILEAIRNNQYRDKTIVIAFIDQSVKDVPPYIIPCRAGRVVDAQDYRTTISIDIELGDLCFCSAIDRLQNELTSNLESEIPKWENSKLVGKWFLPARIDCLEMAPFSDKAIWHEIVNQLQNRQPLEGFDFVRFEGIYEYRECNNKVKRLNTHYELDSEESYRLVIYHYKKAESDYKSRINILYSSKLIDLLSSDFRQIDSRYDEKEFPFTTYPTTKTETGFIDLYISDGAREWQLLNIRIKVCANYLRSIKNAIAIGFFISSSGATAMIAADKFSWSWYLLSLAMGIAAGFVSIFRLPKGI